MEFFSFSSANISSAFVRQTRTVTMEYCSSFLIHVYPPNLFASKEVAFKFMVCVSLWKWYFKKVSVKLSSDQMAAPCQQQQQFIAGRSSCFLLFDLYNIFAKKKLHQSRLFSKTTIDLTVKCRTRCKLLFRRVKLQMSVGNIFTIHVCKLQKWTYLWTLLILAWLHTCRWVVDVDK